MSAAVDIIVDNRLRMPKDALPKKALTALRKAFTHSNPEFYKKRAMKKPTWNVDREIKTWASSQDRAGTWWITLPRGGTSTVREVLEEHGLEWEFIDKRSTGRGDFGYTGDWVTPQLFPPHNMELWDHQQRILEAILKWENCIIRSPTASGKTTAMLAAIVACNVPAIVAMNDKKLIKQWRENIVDELGIPLEQIGMIGGGKYNLKPLTLAMQQTLWKLSDTKWEEINETFGFFGIDECQGTAARTFLVAGDRSTAKYRVGVSDDERRHDGKEFLNYDIFGRVAVEITDEELVDKGHILDVAVRLVPTDYENAEYMDEDGARDFNDLLDDMIADDDRNDVIRSVVEMCMRSTEPTLVFSHRREHCSILDMIFTGDGHPSGLLIGGDDYSETFDATKEGLASGDKLIGVGTYRATGTGQNMPTVTCGVATTPIHGNKQFVRQVKGRLRRKPDGKTKATLYVIWDRKIYGREAVMHLKRKVADCKVLHDGKWIPVKPYLEEHYGEQIRRERTTKKTPFATAEDLRG